ncbi:hypothetical protein OHO27_20690 [Streptomyces sp. NBC_00443]
MVPHEPADSPAELTPTTSHGWCAWHQGTARGVRLISAIEQGSGPGTAAHRFACRPCREAYDLTPLADQP